MSFLFAGVEAKEAAKAIKTQAKQAASGRTISSGGGTNVPKGVVNQGGEVTVPPAGGGGGISPVVIGGGIVAALVAVAAFRKSRKK